MSQLVGDNEGEDGNIEETEWCEVGFVQGESASWKSSYIAAGATPRSHHGLSISRRRRSWIVNSDV